MRVDVKPPPEASLNGAKLDHVARLVDQLRQKGLDATSTSPLPNGDVEIYLNVDGRLAMDVEHIVVSPDGTTYAPQGISTLARVIHDLVEDAINACKA